MFGVSFSADTQGGHVELNLQFSLSETKDFSSKKSSGVCKDLVQLILGAAMYAMSENRWATWIFINLWAQMGSTAG